MDAIPKELMDFLKAAAEVPAEKRVTNPEEFEVIPFEYSESLGRCVLGQPMHYLDWKAKFSRDKS